MKRLSLFPFLLFFGLLTAQTDSLQKGYTLKYSFNKSGSHYLKASLTTQIWARYNQSNPGTTVFGYEKNETFDIGLRRVRAVISGQLSDKVYFFTQAGINNFTTISERKMPIFFHDATADFAVTKKSLSIGGGLTGWTGFARFSAPSIGTIMGYDAPLFEQSTNDATDQFLRKLSIYAKGKLLKFDYRLIVSTPMAAQNSNVVRNISTNSEFSLRPPELQYSGYFMYQFFDEENNDNPYKAGTYLGEKTIFNVGAGFQYQANAMWRWNNSLQQDTINEDMLHFAVDMFYDRPVGKKGAAISLYAAWINFNFGKGYLRNLGVMNPANGVLATANNLNGAGSAFPMLGTGTTFFTQLGYLLPKNTLGENKGQLMPYIMVMNANYDRLNDNMVVFDAGINWLLNGHNSKLTLNWQNRPVFRLTDQRQSERKSMVLVQFQVAI